jgi:uncharacterized protein (DUF3084 family)
VANLDIGDTPMIRITTAGTRAFAASAAACVLCVITVTAQGRRAPATLDHVLEELQGLRADLQTSSAANLRVQTLVARVTLQEQRLKALSEQLNLAQTQLESIADDRRERERQLRSLEASPPSPSVSAAEMRAVIDETKQLLASLTEREEVLRARASDLAGLVRAEQDRWIEFNNRLDALEAALDRRP